MSIIPALLAVFAVASLQIDLPAARFTRETKLPALLRELLEVGEYFGHGLGVALAAVLIATLVPGDRHKLSRLLLASFGAGGLADLIKTSVFRFRPYHFPLADRNITDPFETFTTPPGYVPESISASFPSAHTATACALAVALSACYPRGRRIFWSLAVLCGIQRVWSNAHFLSDVFAGAFVGLLAARLLLTPAVGRRRMRFDRRESVAGNSAAVATPSPCHSAAV